MDLLELEDCIAETMLFQQPQTAVPLASDRQI